MDFILVPDALFASEVRHTLAQHNTVGTRVGSFPVLLETLAKLWVMDLPEDGLNDPWQDALQQRALAMHDAFWANSIKADECGTLRALSTSLKLVLDHCPLGQALQPFSASAGVELTRHQRYYNDLVRLQQAIGCRPAAQQLAEQWLAVIDDLNLEPLHLFPLYQAGVFTEHDLLPWQRSVLNKLAEKGWVKPLHERYESLVAALQPPTEACKPIRELADTLFTQPAQPLPNPGDAIQWLTCRDAAEEAEATAVLVQQAINSGTEPEHIAIAVPRGTDHGQWLGHYLQRAGITVSNLRPAANQFDWQTALLQNLLTNRADPQVRMAMQSVLINPLMPWSATTGYRLAKKYANYEVLDNEPESRQVFIDLLLQDPDEIETAASLINWLNTISDGLNYRGVIGLSKKRWQQLLQQTERLLALYSQPSFSEQLQSVLPHLNVGSMTLNGERTRYLNAVLVVEEGEPLPVNVQQLYVLGFNNGHYQYQPAYTGALSRQQWDDLALPIPTQAAEQQRWQQGFRQLLSRATSKLVFLRALADAEGKRLDPSDTLIDMALCYCPADQLAPESLEQPLSALADIWADIEPTRSVTPPLAATLELGQPLLGQFKTRDGKQRPESPSSLEKMMLSPLAWLLSRLRIEPEQWEVATQSSALAGIIAHQVFETYHPNQDDEWSEKVVEERFEQAVTQHAPFLHSAQCSTEKQHLRNSVIKALAALHEWRQKEGWEIIASEQSLSGTISGFGDLAVAGNADAILKNSAGDVLILDYKNSKHKNRLTQLQKGYELQTRLYRELYRQQPDAAGGMVDSAYYALKDQTLVAAKAFNRSTKLNTAHPGDISLADQSALAEQRLKDVLHQLQNGTIELNKATDAGDWKKKGLSIYTLKDNRLVQRFTLADNNSEADA